MLSETGLSVESGLVNSDSVTNAEDREFLFGMRSQCDAIMVSAKTALVENYRPSKFAPIFVIDRHSTAAARELERQAEGDKHPIEVHASVGEALLRLPEGSQSRVLLECGRTMAKSLFEDARGESRLVQALVSVTTDSSETGRRRALELISELSPKWRLRESIQEQNFYSSFTND